MVLKPYSFKSIILGIQFLLVAFGATVLVPILTGMDSSVALLTAGIGTLIFHIVSKGMVPIFLGSSFAFIAPIVYASKHYGWAGTFIGLASVGILYSLVALLIKVKGIDFVAKLFPAVVIGPVVMVIGLSLAPVAVGMASSNWLIAVITLLAAIFTVQYGKGMIKLVPVFAGLIVGYVVSLCFGLVNLEALYNAQWFTLPKITTPSFDEHTLEAIVYILPVAIAPIIEHIGGIYAISDVAGKDFVKNPGIHRTMLGDGISCLFAGLIGGPPNTTYAEVTGAISLTKVTYPFILRISAITAIVFAFVGKIQGFLHTIPQAVLGGVMILLFGMIASIGIKVILDSKVSFSNAKNQILVSVILVIGIGGASISFGSFTMSGIGLAAVVGVILNLILPEKLSFKKEIKQE